MAGADESQIYRELMRFKPEGLSANAWAVKAGVSRTVWADMRRQENPSRRTLEKLLTAAGSSLAEFEALRVGVEPNYLSNNAGSVGEGAQRAWNPAQPQPLPLLATTLAGDWGSPGSRIELLEIENGRRSSGYPVRPALPRMKRPTPLRLLEIRCGLAFGQGAGSLCRRGRRSRLATTYW